MIAPEDMADTHRATFTQSRPWSSDEFRDLCNSPHCHVFGDQRSFALVRSILGEDELLTIATHPDHQRRGLAAQVMQIWLDAAKSHERAFLEVAADNAPALALYRRFGFTECGTRRGYYPRPGETAVDALVMARPLAASSLGETC